MEILLFDQNTGGHHAAYAGRLVNALSEYGINSDIVASEDSRISEFTDESNIFFINGDTERNLRKLFDIALDREYDAVHILYLDDIVGEMDLIEIDDLYPGSVIATLNGSFFNHFILNEINASILRYGLPISSIIPRGMGFGTALKEYYIQRVVKEGKVDKVLVHSDEAEEYLLNIINSNSTSVIPDPVKSADHNVSKSEARDLIDVDKGGSQLLYFGELRRNKGIKFLLNSLNTYSGPEFRLVIAGSPNDIGRAEVERLIDSIQIPVVSRLEYIEESQMPYYFQASDGIILPYKREFGSRRTSGVFQKACGHNRPVIAPDFGVMGRQTKEYNLGLTFKPESTAHLNQTITEFVKSGEKMYNSDGLERFARDHSFNRLAEKLSKIYQAA
ncbi:glycosyltransferase [Halopenitus persicus]|uniref:Glycosyltransferase involved in cell wall bisynthesis n=1 Tax=Halopenitus persicus TaxID=1048396 RepID=A0A1H3MDF2_9EURY|nr:glycosyltransferase [Halopenitus persicus]SDY74613.1 Glycosyltransferase involved in cell wall bisynthesis [Halopenitus persicus]